MHLTNLSKHLQNAYCSSFLIFFLAFSINTNAQLHSTIIIAITLNDSIIMAADSRAMIKDLGDSECSGAVAFIDSLPKIFKINNSLIAIAGEAMIGPKFIQTIITEFNESNIRKMDFQTTILAFQDYLDHKFPVVKFPNSSKEVFLAGGYTNGTPQIIIFNRSDKKAGKSVFQTNTALTNRVEIIKYFPRHQYSVDNCFTVGKVFESSIYDYAKKENFEVCIGGPITIVNMIGPNKIDWVQNNFNYKKYRSFNQFIHLIEKGTIVLTPVVENGIEKALRILKSNPNYKH